MENKLEDLYVLKSTDVSATAAMCNRAYANYPFNVYFFPDSQKRDVVGRQFFDLTVRMGLKYSEMYATSEKLEGVAIWDYSDRKPGVVAFIRTGTLADLSLFFQAGLKRTLKTIQMYNYCEERRKGCLSGRYMYLTSLATDPAYQGKGFGSKLVKSMFRRLDREKLPCVLETQLVKNVEIYENMGFEVIDESIILDTDIRNWIMMRKPE